MELTLCREFSLLPEDERFLEEYGLNWETIRDGSQWVLLHEFPTHEGYNHNHVTVAIRLEAGYPKAQLDMVYVYPHLARKDRIPINATNNKQVIKGTSYQRWSRHRSNQNPWKADEDNLGSHITLIEEWFSREFEK